MSMDNETKNKKEMKNLTHPWKTFGFEAFLFSLSLGFGILAGLKLNEIFKAQEVPVPSISPSQFLGYFLFGTIFILSIIYFFKFKKVKRIFFKTIFFLAIGFGNLFFFSLWLPDILTFSLLTILIIFLVKKPCLVVHNFALIFAVAGMGAGLGLSFQPEIVILLLLFFSIYDFIAVYKTKHMVKMAKEMIEHQAILGIVIPQKLSDFSAQLEEIKPGGKFLILGAGDMIFPLILTVSLIPQGILSSLIVAFFSLIGLLAGFLIFIAPKIRRPMPALPPIAFFSIIGYLITRII